MPIYEYQCNDCGAEFEKLVRSAGESAGVECPSCGEKRLTLRLSVFAAHSGNSKECPAAPVCPLGMCRNPELCGRN
jgi:putative FmdB family regulatory protein